MALKIRDGYRFFPQPEYPDVPYAEYRARISRAQELMSKHGVDCLLLWSRQNVRYFFGYQSTHWNITSIQPGVGIIPVEGEPRLIVPDFFIGTAEQQCWIRNIVQQEDPHQPREIRELPANVGRMVADMGYGRGRVGLEMGELGCTWIPRPLNDIRTLEASLPNAKMVDGDKVIWGCRMIKSPLEVERIARAVDGHRAVQRALVDGYRPGMTEMDLAKIAYTAAAQLGYGFIGDSIGLWGSFRAALNKEPMGDIGVHEGAVVGRDDYIFYCMCFQHKGYQPDSSRILQLSEPRPEQRRLYETIWKGEDAAAAIIKPGVKAKDVFNAMYAPIAAEGLPVLDMGGHGTGLDTHEPPSIDASNDFELQEGMVLSIEPWSYLSLKIDGGLGKVGIQDQFVVTADGCKKIAALDRNIIHVAHLN
jgi:Xaa-Pro aminopeptidase